MKLWYAIWVSAIWLVMVPLKAEEAIEEADLGLGLVNPGYHEQPVWFKNSFLDLQEDVAEAAENNKRVLFYFYQDGCPYCEKLLETNFSQRDIENKTRQHFDVIALNIWGDREVTGLNGEMTTEKKIAEDFKVMYTPTLLFVDEQSEQVLRLNGYYPPDKFTVALDYVAERREKEESIRAYAARVNPPRASGTLHTENNFLQPPLDLNNTTDKPLMVIFEQHACSACDELHQEVLKRTESIEQLDRFNVLVLDMWSDESLVTPTGQRMNTRDWAKQLGIQYVPSFVFFNRGEEVFRAEAYLRAFHVQSIMDYVATAAYETQPNFQRFIQSRADALEAQGIHVDIMD